MPLQHTFWLADDDARSLASAVRQRLPPGAGIALDAGDVPPAGLAGIVAHQIPLTPEEIQASPSVVLLSAGLDERDRVQGALAGWERTRLAIVEDPAPSIHAERTLALVLTLAQRISDAERALSESSPDQSALVTAETNTSNWLDLPQSPPLMGQRFGLVGFRPVGRELAARAAALDMEIVYWGGPAPDRERQEMRAAAMRSGAIELSFDQIIRTADLIVIDLGPDEEAQRLIDAPELALMREGSLLVNTTNGRAIDEGALIQALRGGYLGGAALDVFNYEPLPADSPLRDLDRVLLTPHIARPPEALVHRVMANRVAAALLKLSGSPDRPRRVRRVERRRG